MVSRLLACHFVQPVSNVGILDVYVATSDGKVVAHSDPKVASSGTDMKVIDIVQEFVQTVGRAPVSMPFILKDSTGVMRQMLGTFIRVADDSGWGVIAQMAEAKAHEGAADPGDCSSSVSLRRWQGITA